MGGGDIEALLDKAEGHRLPIEDAITLALQITQGLEFAHDHDLVHRDLKPGNVWLTAPYQLSQSPKSVQSVVPSRGGDGAVAKIGDFGLAVSLDRSRLTRAGMMVGTVAYMPPEQAMGGDVSPRSDLYSLGAMLYEMVCGRPPFVGEESVAIITHHLNTPPVSPTWHRPECPPGLEALILRLLEKDASKRPPGAREVLADLEALDLTAVRPAPEGPDADPLSRLASGTFVGRTQELAQGRSALDGAISGRAGLLLLAGDRGIGKTRLAEEIATYASLRGAVVLWGRTHEAGGAPAYWPWIRRSASGPARRLVAS